MVDLSIPPSPRARLGEHGEPRAPSDTTGTEHHASIGGGSIADSSSYDSPQPSNNYGWPHLAQKIREVPEFAAFPRFRQLNFKNLLCYQAELELLHRQIETAELEDCNKEGAKRKFDIRFYDSIVEEGNSEYHKLLLELRIGLREYSTHLFDVLID